MLSGVLLLVFPLEVFCSPIKICVFSIASFSPIEGISLCGPTRGTRSGGKLNLLLYIKDYIKNKVGIIEQRYLVAGNGNRS